MTDHPPTCKGCWTVASGELHREPSHRFCCLCGEPRGDVQQKDGEGPWGEVADLIRSWGFGVIVRYREDGKFLCIITTPNWGMYDGESEKPMVAVTMALARLAVGPTIAGQAGPWD